MLERKMLIDAALQVAIIKQKEFEYASDKTLHDLCIGSMTHADGLNLTSMHILSMDVFSDVGLCVSTKPFSCCSVAQAANQLVVNHKK